MVDEDGIGLGSILGGFKIERELGRGGMGVVYKGHELSLNRKVALKVLSQRLCRDEEFIKRFKREARVIAALNHPNIVNILSYGEEQGRYYFAMEYIAGKDLGQILQDKSSIPLDEALSVAAQVASALDEAGPRGVVHRDLKPSNIMIDDVGRAKVTDFGVAHFEDSDAKLTRTGLFLGTPEYASPEQATGRTLDVRSDIYALGAVLYRMLSGKPPITGESPLAVVTKIATEPVTPIGQIITALPKPVCDMIDKMMAKDPDERFQTPRDVLVAIDHCVDSLDMDAPLAKSKAVDARIAPPPPPQKKSRAKFWGGIAGVALAVLLVVWLVEGGFLREKSLTEQKATDETQAESADAKTVADEVAPGLAASASATKEVEEAGPAVEEKSGDKSAVLKRSLILPKIPTVLMVVSGDEAMASLVRAHLESISGGSGLRVGSISEVPMLREKMQLGDMPITWHSIKEFVPKERAHILLLAQVQKTGSMNLKYYGRTQEMITATFSARAVDMATGISVATPASSSVKFTQLDMEENLRKTVTSAASGIGAEIKGYWEKRIRASRKTG
jgi:predicted Ser/Thr protein kinase